MRALATPHCPLCGNRGWRLDAQPLPLSTCLRCGAGFPTGFAQSGLEA